MIKNKLSFSNKEIGENRIIYIYRYVSWFLTSLFYLLQGPRSYLVFKIGVIISLYFCAKIISDLYAKHRESPKALQIITLTETIGIALLLIPTGGIKSPFLWYALNPGLVAASFLNMHFSVVNLLFYITISTTISSIIFRQEGGEVRELLYNNSHILLTMILVTFALQLLSSMARNLKLNAAALFDQSEKLKEMNYKLNKVNERYRESIDHIMSLYHSVGAFTAQNNIYDLLQTFTDYAVLLTRSPLAFFWLKSFRENDGMIVAKGENTDDIEMYLINELETREFEFVNIDTPVKAEIISRNFLVITVRSPSRYYGLIGININEAINKEFNDFQMQQLTFLSGLSGVMLERFDLEDVSNQLIIAEEQNRIANEMHDNVSQRLFSIVYAAHALAAGMGKAGKQELLGELELIKQSANTAAQELRSTIYKLSFRKRRESTFIQGIKKYLDEVSAINHIKVELDISGDEGLISAVLKKALHRIIREASGNAVRHGKCDRLKLKISIQASFTIVNIADNGTGFSLEELDRQDNAGLGLYNMKNLVKTFYGKLKIDSQIGIGTEIHIVIPNEKILSSKIGEIAL